MFIQFLIQLFLPVYRESLRGVNPILLYIARSASFSSFSGQSEMELGHVCFDQVLVRKV